VHLLKRTEGVGDASSPASTTSFWSSIVTISPVLLRHCHPWSMGVLAGRGNPSSLYARAASDNAASIRVLTKCGFRTVDEGRRFAHGRKEETDDVVLRLAA